MEQIGLGEQSIIVKLNKSDPTKCVKISRSLDWVIQHEYTVAEQLQTISILKQHFVKVFGVQKVYTKRDVIRIKTVNDIVLNPTEDFIPRLGLEMEYISNSTTLTDYLKTTKDDVRPLIQHIILILRAAYLTIQFTHYDLHTDNILLVPVDLQKKNAKITFVFDDGESYTIPQPSMHPIIIDYGRAYCSALNDTQLSVEMYHTHIGVFTVCPHPTVDIIFFLNCCGGRIKRCMRQWSNHLDASGWWNNTEDVSASDRACSYIGQYATNSGSIIFSSYLDEGFIIFSYLVSYPFPEIKKYDPTVYWPYYFKKFLSQWVKLEKWLDNIAVMEFCLIDFVYLVNKYTTPTTFDHDSIKANVTAFMDKYCNNIWDDSEIDWIMFIESAYRAGVMLGSLMQKIITEQLRKFNELTMKETEFKNVLALFNTTNPQKV